MIYQKDDAKGKIVLSGGVILIRELILNQIV